MQFEGAGLAGGDHQADLADARGIERRSVADFASADAGAEVCQWQVQGLPVGACGREDGLVVEAVEAVVGQQAEIELLVVAAQFVQAGPGAWQSSRSGAGSQRRKATVAFQ